MYVRKGIRLTRLVRDSWQIVVVSVSLSVFVYVVHQVFGFDILELPALPVATIGVVVSLYLGFLSSSAYARWWEARTIWGQIINASRAWANCCLSLPDSPGPGQDQVSDEARLLVRRHLAWVNALAAQLRPDPPGQAAATSDPTEAASGTQARSLSYLGEAHVAKLAGTANPAVHILRLQGDSLRHLRQSGQLDDYRFVEMMRFLTVFYDCQGGCERIRNTPFPVQFTFFGRLFTWMLIVLMPFAFVDAFVRLAEHHPLVSQVAQNFLFLLIPFNTIISTLFFFLERVSESCLDPFDGRATDVPIQALTRLIEIDLLQMLGESRVPPPCQPVNGILN